MRAAVPLAIAALFALFLFLPAGRLDLPWFWAVVLTLPVLGALLGRRIDPGLLRERFRPGPGGIDRNLRWLAAPFLLSSLVVAGLDTRFGWSAVPLAVRIAAYVAFLAATGLALWAMSVNRFFSPVVRIQAERGHQLVTSGPYAWVRHPGYAGVLLGYPWIGLVLGSWWSLLPMAVVLALIVRRTRIEDRYLHENLPGYVEYAARVRWRMLPGVW